MRHLLRRTRQAPVRSKAPSSPLSGFHGRWPAATGSSSAAASAGWAGVYAAMDTALRRRVAVKVILDHLVGTEVARRFPVEAQAAATFAHPNVVTVHDYGIDAGNRPFLVMELLEGVTLRDELKRCARLDLVANPGHSSGRLPGGRGRAPATADSS